MNFFTDKLIIVYFPTQAGGKFISNCLSLSRYAVPQDRETASIDLNGPIPDDYYTWKCQQVLQTLPPLGTSMTNWRHYEFGCYQLFGRGYLKFKGFDGHELDEISDISSQLSNQTDKDFFMVTHDKNELVTIKKTFPNSRVLTLINFSKFICRATELKNPEKNINDMMFWLMDWDYLTELTNYTFNVDSIFNSTNFCNEMKKLYIELGYNDFDQVQLLDFYKAYIRLHNIDYE